MKWFLGQFAIAVAALTVVGASSGRGGTQGNSASETIRPPMHRAWTYVTGERTEVLAVRDGLIYFTSRQRTGALKLSDGKVVWEKKRPDWAMHSEIDGKRIYVSTSSLKEGRLLAYDLSDGKERVLRNLPDGADSFAVWKNQVCLLLPDRKVVVFDLDRGKALWEVSVGDGKRQKGVSLDNVTLCAGVLVVALEDTGWQCIDPASGKTLWKRAAKYATNGKPVAIGERVLLDSPDLALVEPRTGKEAWSRPDLQIEGFGIGAGVLVAEVSDRIVGVDIKSGKTLWSIAGGSEGFSMGTNDHLWLGDAKGVLSWSERFAHISPAGKELWSSPVFFDGRPAFVNSSSMVSSDGDRILCYVPGDYPTVPEKEEERKAFAERNVRDFELLDQSEKKRVGGLAKYAAEPLIRRYVEWAKAEQAEYDSKDSLGGELGMLRYDLLQTTARMLDEMCGPEHTAALSRAIEEVGPKNSYRSELVSILGRKGNPDDFIEGYIKELRASRSINDPNRDTGETLKAVSESNHPSAVAFMLEVLKDAKAPDEWRHEAYVHLAKTGGSAGVDAVLAARAKMAPRPKWEERIVVAKIPRNSIVSEKTDATGRTWRLFTSGVLGNYSDLFVARKTGESWSAPLFVGVYTRDTWQGKAPTEFRGVPMKTFLELDWIEVLPGDAEIRKDSDGDGLTDVAEKRLGTNANDTDTDHDGLGDAVDPCPNVAPRAMGDKEKIIAACVEARFFAEDWGVPAVISIEGVEPFEMYGYHAPLLWDVKGYAGDLPRMYNTGVNMLSFSTASSERGTPISISADGKSATTLIRRYSGGLNGDGIVAKLIKVGDDWFVVSLEMAYVS